MRRLTREDYNTYYPLINEFRPTNISRESFEHFMDELPSNIQIWILEDNNRIIATTTLILEPKLIFNGCTYAHIEDVCVAKDYRKQKKGSILLEEIIAHCRLLDCKKITLVCNESIKHFYESNSFEQRGIQLCILLKE
jgi:N-acetylglutamate synthase-like GNAT family acetyltransferase